MKKVTVRRSDCCDANLYNDPGTGVFGRCNACHEICGVVTYQQEVPEFMDLMSDLQARDIPPAAWERDAAQEKPKRRSK